MIEALRRLVMGLALAGVTSCSGIPGPQPPQPPEPPAPEPQCFEGQACGCWHRPPEALGWLYACCQPGVPGGVVNVQDPAQCIAAPPPPPGDGCVLAGEEVTPSTQTNTLGGAVNTAMRKLVPRCEIGADCVINEYTQQSWFAAVATELRKAGWCAGPGGDEMQVSPAPSDPWQNFHVFAGDDSPALPAPPGARRTVNWSPQAWRGSWVAPAGPPGPVEPPAPPPTGETCPVAPCPIRTWTQATLPPGWGPEEIGRPAYQINSAAYGDRGDSTPVVIRQEPYCAAIGMSPYADGQPRASCPMREDGHPDRVAIENWILFGGPVRDSKNGQDCMPPGARNPFAFLAGTGNCRICNVPKTACTGWY